VREIIAVAVAVVAVAIAVVVVVAAAAAAALQVVDELNEENKELSRYASDAVALKQWITTNISVPFFLITFKFICCLFLYMCSINFLLIFY
jgi:NADH:ubiquinone oxidoreductase subunit 3 (subunit A)